MGKKDFPPRIINGTRPVFVNHSRDTFIEWSARYEIKKREIVSSLLWNFVSTGGDNFLNDFISYLHLLDRVFVAMRANEI